LGHEIKEGLSYGTIAAWKGIETSLVNNLVDSMLERFEEVMTNEGYHISC
jgi:hypothetical protein